MASILLVEFVDKGLPYNDDFSIADAQIMGAPKQPALLDPVIQGLGVKPKMRCGLLDRQRIRWVFGWITILRQAIQ